MFGDLLERLKNFYYGDSNERGIRLHAALGGWEIGLIVAAVILIFGVGKLGNVGGALGKSIREFRKEKDKIDSDPNLNVKNNNEAENGQLESKPQQENKN